jgi:hypothetical protein
MTEQEQKLLNKFLSSIEEDEKFFKEIMNRTDEDARLLQWIVNNNINPYGVFPYYIAGSLSELQSFVAIYIKMTYQRKHCEINYVNVERTSSSHDHVDNLGPRVVFVGKWEDDFHALVKKELNLPDDELPWESYTYDFDILENVDAFIETYNRVEDYHKNRYEENSKLADRWLS